MMQLCTSTVVCWTIISEKIDLPPELLDIQHSCQLPETPHDICIQLINDYYSSVMSCIKSECMSTLPSQRVASYHEQYVIPG